MTLRTLLSGLVCMGFVACAGAQTDEAETTVYTIEDVEAVPEQWRLADPENLVVLTTSRGQIILELLPSMAPTHVSQFKTYVRAGLYDGTPFHRVIRGFMAQGGDVASMHGEDKMLGQMAGEFTIRRAPEAFSIDPVGPVDSATNGFHKGIPIQSVARFMAELSFDGLVETWIPHCEGVLSTARTDDKNSADAQFFLISDQARHLDRKYTAKGRVVIGLDVVKTIKLGPSPDGGPISNPDILLTAQVVADMPEEDRLQVYVQRTDTPDWTERLMAADRSGDDICDLPHVPAIIG